MKTKLQLIKVVGAGMAASALVSFAGEAPAPIVLTEPAESRGSLCDSLWEYSNWYENSSNPILQSFVFTGRLHADAAIFDESDLGSYDDIVWRRLRMGFKAQMFEDFTVHAEADFELNYSDPFYSRLTDSYVGWKPSKAFGLKLGKQSAGFTLDGATSSKKLITVSRSNLANNLWFPVEYHVGGSVAGSLQQWTYTAGVFRADGDPEFGELDADAGEFYLASVGRDLTDFVDLDTAEVRMDYVYHDADLDHFGEGTRNLKQVASLVTRWEEGSWGLWTDVSLAEGIASRGQSDLFGLQLMPFYDFTEKVQGVFRYTYLESEGDNGVRLARYESRITEDRGDELHEFYAGLNYYICDHRLKLQTGVQYTTMDDAADDGGEYEGWGWSTGLRYSW